MIYMLDTDCYIEITADIMGILQVKYSIESHY